MSQDIIADALNQIMNAKKARKTNVVITKHSKLLRNRQLLLAELKKREATIRHLTESLTITGN